MSQMKTGEANGMSRDRPAIDWQLILNRHDRWLRMVVYARLGEPQAVDEVMQEVALAAVRQGSPIADLTKVAPWLYRLAVRQVLLYRRRVGRQRNRTRQFADRFQPTEHDTRTPDPLAWLLADERQRLVREALMTLKAQDAEILMLKYSENWNYHQIAERIGISHSAVETRLHRARKRLREQLMAMDVVGVS
jgi:RNA polymerase sigma-70 factor (ECF subfamily)